jgi:hypothetical protein
MKVKFSEIDSRGKKYIDCSECDRGGNGKSDEKCSCGWRVKKGRKGGCFIGALIDGLEF